MARAQPSARPVQARTAAPAAGPEPQRSPASSRRGQVATRAKIDSCGGRRWLAFGRSAEPPLLAVARIPSGDSRWGNAGPTPLPR